MSKKDDSKPKIPWSVVVFIISLIVSAILSYLSAVMLNGAGLILATIILLVIVAIGIMFDMVGVAVTAANIQPFHSMSAHKERGAKEAVQLLKYSAEVSSFFCDVFGDICGIISGSTTGVIVLRLVEQFTVSSLIVSCIITALVSGLTIGGKAVGKDFAIKNSTQVIHFVGKLMNRLHISIKK